jgi:hypothetical protein
LISIESVRARSFSNAILLSPHITMIIQSA